METQNATHAQLESALYATLTRLSHILAFQARLQQQGTTHYAPPAPRKLTEQLKVDVAKFDAVCDEVERKLLRAIAVIERDVRKATGASPPSAPLPEQPAVKAETGADAVLPFGLPSSMTESVAIPGSAAAAMPIDLTNSPSPNAPPLPFQLPGTATSADAETSQSNSTQSAQPVPVADTAADDLNALLSSLNVPPFGGLDTSAKPALTSNPPETSINSSATFPDLSLEALDNLLNGSALSASGSSAPPASSSLSAGLGSFGLDFPSISSAPPQSSATVAPAASSAAPNLDLSTFDFSSLGLTGSAGPTASSGAGGASGPGELDLSGLGALDISSFGAEAGGQDGGTGAVDLDELLKSLGGQ